MLSGPGGVGKSTIARRLAGADPGLHLSVSWTTRALRPGEDPHAYVFATREDFLRRVEAGGFLEWAEFNGNLYGTPSDGDLPPDVDLLLEIDIQGARQVRKRRPDAQVILVTAPSWDEIAQRMAARGDDGESIARRLAIGRREEEEGRALADAVVVNEDLDRTVAELRTIIAQRRGSAGSAA